MAVSLLFVWDSFGRALFSKRYSLELTWVLFWEEAEENLEGCSFMLILDYMKG